MPIDVQTLHRVPTATDGSIRIFRAASICFLLILVSSIASAAEYRLDTDDLLRISVLDRSELSGEYRVGPSGGVSLPLLGEVSARGLTPAQLEREIAGRLATSSERKGQIVNIEVKAYRPFFIVGDVEHPGRYPCGPNMIVIHAVAIAGGFKDLDDQGFVARAEIYRAQEKLRGLQDELGLVRLREARYRAEERDAEDLAIPDRLSIYWGDSRREQATADERAILRERLATMRREVEALEQGKEVYVEEIRAHREKIAAENERGELLKAQLSELDAGDERLVPKMVLWSLEQDRVTIEANKRELEAFIARARQKMEEQDLAVLRLKNERALEIAAGIKQAEDEKTQLQASIEETERFLAQARSWLLREPDEVRPDEDLFRIAREGPDGLSEISADRYSKVLPGDVVTVVPALRPARRR